MVEPLPLNPHGEPPWFEKLMEELHGEIPWEHPRVTIRGRIPRMAGMIAAGFAAGAHAIILRKSQAESQAQLDDGAMMRVERLKGVSHGFEVEDLSAL